MQLFEKGELADEKEGTGLVGALVVDCNCGCGGEAIGITIKGLLSIQDLKVAKREISKTVNQVIKQKEGER